jgi:DNA repair exonuclease SbcCD ATPase subunit
MATAERSQREATFRVENVGGIERTEVEIPPGVTVLSGKNATNRTSFLQAVMAVLGSQQATLKGDAEDGRVRLNLGGDQYERTLTRRNGNVHFAGEGYLEDPEIAELFAFLLESNEARQAVARGENLRDLIMEPVDIEQLKTEIQQLEEEKGEINDELATIESLKRDLPDLESRRNSVESDIGDKRERLREKEDEIESASVDVEEGRAEQARIDETFEELRSTRSDLESVRYDIETERESITSLKQERNELEAELSELSDESENEFDTLEDRIEALRDRKQSLEREIQDLQSVIQFNENRLEEDDSGGIGEFGDTPVDDGSLTDRLVEEEAVICWTCGSEVKPAQIESTLDHLRELRSEKLDDASDVEAELDELLSERRSVQQRRRKAERLESRLADVEAELESRREAVETLEERKAELVADVKELESEVEDTETEDFSEVLDLHREANELEFDIERLESNLANVEERIEEVEGTIGREDDLRDRREQLLDELEDRRTRIEQIETNAVEQFNTHMDAILDLLGYENLERIWIERREETVRQGRERVTQSVFELHVVRSTQSGAAYEDTVDHLSESEREVTGLIFGLAGYLVHDLHETVPFMLLDSLEAIDSDRIAALVEYFSDYAEYLVVALLPEDAQALDGDYTHLSDI